MPAASEAVGAPGGSGGGGGGGDVEQEYEIRNDEGFVYKVARGAHLDSAPSSSSQPAAGLDPKAAGLRRRRRALLRLRDKRLRDLARWEALASELLAPLPAPQPPASPPASSQPVAAVAASSSSASVLDDLIAQVDTQTEFLKRARQWCDEANALCDAREADIFDSIVPSLWGADPKELIAGLCSPGGNTASGNLDEQNGHQEAPGVSSTGAQMIQNSFNKQTRGHGLPPPIPPIPTESRKRKRVTTLSGSNNASSQVSSEPRRKKTSGSTSTAPGTPGSATRRKAESTPGSVTRRKAESTPASASRRKAELTPGSALRRKAESTPGSASRRKAESTTGSASRRKAESTPSRSPDIVSPGPLTRRRASAKDESPEGS